MPRIIIPDTCLCAIVRDERMNSAGGIVDFVDSTVPYVETAVIVDTGSKDGTRKLLEEQAVEHHNLAVHYTEFYGFASSRNFALWRVRLGPKTRRVLVLDADERLTRNDFRDLMLFIEENPARGYNFDLLNVEPNRSHLTNFANNPRLFDALYQLVHYKGVEEVGLWESLYIGDRLFRNIPGATVYTGISIKHFLPNIHALARKREWYESLRTGETDAHYQNHPIDQWKTFNPRRDEYR